MSCCARVCVLFLASLILPAAASAAATVYIDPTATAGGDGSHAHPYNGWTFGALVAGTTYVQRAGTQYTGVVYDQTPATAQAPIVIGPYGTGSAPVINGVVDFAGASYATLRGFQLTGSRYAPVIIQQGSAHITITRNVITGSAQGIWLGNQAGGGNVVRGNAIVGAVGAGILVADIVSVPGSPTRIDGNTVTGCGTDGIQIAANDVQVTGNVVTGNGRAGPGASGIHVFASSASAGVGQRNTITGNLTIGNLDPFDQDGNGILLDQWATGNTVSANLAMGNDGAGIALYDAGANSVTGNVAFGNAADSGHTHSLHAELILNSQIGLTAGNTASNNTLLSFRPAGFAAFVDPLAAQAGNHFAGNVLENPGGAAVYDAGGQQGQDVAVWNSLLGATDRGAGVSLASLQPGGRYSYVFPASTRLALVGQTVNLVGWSPRFGLAGVAN